MEFMGNFTIPSSTTNRCSQVRWKIQKTGRARINRKSFKGWGFAIITTKNGEGWVQWPPHPRFRWPCSYPKPLCTIYSWSTTDHIFLSSENSKEFCPLTLRRNRPCGLFSSQEGASLYLGCLICPSWLELLINIWP